VELGEGVITAFPAVCACTAHPNTGKRQIAIKAKAERIAFIVVPNSNDVIVGFSLQTEIQSGSFPQDRPQKAAFFSWMPGFGCGLYTPKTNAHGIKTSGRLRARTTAPIVWILHPLLLHSTNSKDVSNTSVNPQVREILFLS
jgi:hypothetical protein